MKILGLSIFLLLSINCFSQLPLIPMRHTEEYCFQKWSNYFYGYYCYGYFSGKKNEGEVIIKLHSHHESYLKPYIFLVTNIDTFSLKVDYIKKNGFIVSKVKHYELDKIRLINSGIISISIIGVKEDKTPIILMMLIDDELNKQMKEIIIYTKPL